MANSEIIEALSIDTVVFGFKDSGLYVLLVKRALDPARGLWALPGGYIRYDESVEDAAHRILTDQTAVSNIYLEELKTFGRVDRFPLKRVITVGFYALVNMEIFHLNKGEDVLDVQWFNVKRLPDEMALDHRNIYDEALIRLKRKVRHEPVGFSLLPRKFTLLQIKELYESILEKELDKSNFRKKLMKMNLLVPCNEKQQNVAHRAAQLYRFDETVYNELLTKGFVFEM